MTPHEALNQLSYCTLSHTGPDFIHQLVVDAFGAQEPSPNDKPIRLVFALVGLFLFVERGFSGRKVQQVHMTLGRVKRKWPSITIPEFRGTINATTVLAASLDDRDRMIHEWCHCVWEAYARERATIEELLWAYGVIEAR